MREKKTKQRFSSSEAVDWLVKSGAAATRTRAVEIGGRLLSSGLFFPVKQSIHSTSPANHTFGDKSTDLYSFEDPKHLNSSSSPPTSRSGSKTSFSNSSGSFVPPHISSNSSSSSGLALNLKQASKTNSSSASSNRSNGSNSNTFGIGSNSNINSGASTPRSRSKDGTNANPNSFSSSAHMPQPYSIFILGIDKSGKSSVWSALTGKKSGFASVKAPFERPWNFVQMERLTIGLDSNTTYVSEEYANERVTFCIWDFDSKQNKSTSATSNFSSTFSLPYAVHRAYISISSRCSALVVFDVNNPDLVELDYWVASLVQHQPSAPILLVGTHSDTVSAKSKSKIKLLISKRYAKVKNVRGYITMSTKSNSDVDKLRELLLQHSLHSLTAQIKRERPQITLDAELEQSVDAVSQKLNTQRLEGVTFVALEDIRADLKASGSVTEDQVEAALSYMAANGCFLRLPESLDQFTGLYGKAESDIKNWAILDFDYPFKLLFALNAAPPMLKLRGLISLSSVMEAWKAVGVPHEFMLDLLAYQYHMLRTTYCMVSLLINTVIQEQAIESAARDQISANSSNFYQSQNSGSNGSQSSTATRHKTATTATSTKLNNYHRPTAPQQPSSGDFGQAQKILARVPNPESHCFSLPSAIPRSFDQKALGWARVQKNELVRVYALERIPGQMLERACIQLVLAILTQLRTPFLAKPPTNQYSQNDEEAQTSGKKKRTAKSSSNQDDTSPKSHQRRQSASRSKSVIKDGKETVIKRERRKTSAKNPPPTLDPQSNPDSTTTISTSTITSSNPDDATSSVRAASSPQLSPRVGKANKSSSPSSSPLSSDHPLQETQRSLSRERSRQKSRENSEREDSISHSSIEANRTNSSASPSKRRLKLKIASSATPTGSSELLSYSPGSTDSPLASASPTASPLASPRQGRRKASASSLQYSGSPAISSPRGKKSSESSPKESRVQKAPKPSQKQSTNTQNEENEENKSQGHHESAQTQTQNAQQNQTAKSGRDVLQALQDIVCEQIEWTQQGISFTVGGELGFSARLYSIEGPQHETALVIRVTAETFAGSSRGLRLVLDNINAFVLWEYKNAVSDIFIPCSCSDCLRARSSPKYVPLPVFKNAGTFTFEECERAIGSGYATLPCSIYGNEVPLDSLVPDLVMSDLEMFHAEYSDIIKEKQLAQSSNGIVYKGTYDGETVAIKELTVRLSSEGVVDSAASEVFADFRHEVWVTSLLKHENVVGLKAFAIETVLMSGLGDEITIAQAEALRSHLSSREAIDGYRSSSPIGALGQGSHQNSKNSPISSSGSNNASETTANTSTRDSNGASNSNNDSFIINGVNSRGSNGTNFNSLSTLSSLEKVAKLAIVMEYIPNGDLYRWLHDESASLDWAMRLRIAEEIAHGMYFLHHKVNPPILHHDLKSANIFIVDKSPDAPVICRVGDFGEARTNFSYNSREKVDNPLWLAPEVMQKQRYESHADVYAFGIILWEIFSRLLPFEEFPEARTEFRADLEDAIIAGLRPSIHKELVEDMLEISSVENKCIPLYAELMRECWQTDRHRRPTFARIISTLQDIRAIMAFNEETKIIETEKIRESTLLSAVILGEENRSGETDFGNRGSNADESQGAEKDEIRKSRSIHQHHLVLSPTEQEWASIVESTERANADGVSIASLQSQNKLSGPKNSLLPSPEKPIPHTSEQTEIVSSENAGSVSSPIAQTSKDEEESGQTKTSKSQHSPTSDGVDTPNNSKWSNVQPVRSPRSMTESIGSKSKTIGAQSSQSELSPEKTKSVHFNYNESDEKTSEAASPKKKTETFEVIASQTLSHASSTGSIESSSTSKSSESAAAQKTKVLHGIVALNRRDSDTPPPNILGGVRRSSVSGSPARSYESLLREHSNAQSQETPSETKSQYQSSPIAPTPTRTGLTLRKKLAASAMIPVNFLPRSSSTSDSSEDESD